MQQIDHFSHDHPLVFIEEQSNILSKKTAYCFGCREAVLDSSFSCVECKYQLHKKCAEAPLEIDNHPLHVNHCISLHQNPPYGHLHTCDLCKEKRKMFVYYCFICDFSLDINCTLSSLNIDRLFRRFIHNIHRHPLTFIENHKDELKRACCSWCHEPLQDSIYICLDCKFCLHKKCLVLPTKINHPTHSEHPLVLDLRSNYLPCKPCQSEHWGLFFQCSPCKFYIHLECVWPRSIIQDKTHEHPYTLLLKQVPFICDACGFEGNYVSYICHTCHLQVHKKCTSLPHIIKITRHHHPIFLHYFLQRKELEKEDCKICYTKVKKGHGSYYCLKEECSYIVHVTCVIENDNLYNVIDQEDQDDKDFIENLALMSITKLNEFGEAMKIKHFFHEHELKFGDKTEEDNDKHCDGCMLSISTSFYCCSQCNFHLHKTCAELPQKKHHWFHPFPLTLERKNIFRCDLCNHFCSGFYYESESDDEIFYFCLRCANHADALKCEGHQHHLFFDHKSKRKCNACGVGSRYGAYKCKDCNVALDFACITLPHVARHKCDKHFLRLTYQDENDDPKHYCDVCEEQRDSSHWFYYCAICDNSVHPKCTLEKYPFIKIGSTCIYEDHSHPLTFVKKNYEQLECDCIFCDKPCRDFALQCTESSCNYIAHWECIWFRL